MARLDLLLFLVFGSFAAIGLVVAVWCFYRAMKVAGGPEGDLKMFFWAVGSLVGLVIAGMSLAYILLPILLHYGSR